MGRAMATAYLYRHHSRIGTFSIHVNAAGYWQISLEGENLGAGYRHPQAALDDLVGGHCDWPGVTDPSTLGLPDDLGAWAAFGTP